MGEETIKGFEIICNNCKSHDVFISAFDCGVCNSCHYELTCNDCDSSYESEVKQYKKGKIR